MNRMANARTQKLVQMPPVSVVNTSLEHFAKEIPRRGKFSLVSGPSRANVRISDLHAVDAVVPAKYRNGGTVESEVRGMYLVSTNYRTGNHETAEFEHKATGARIRATEFDLLENSRRVYVDPVFHSEQMVPPRVLYDLYATILEIAEVSLVVDLLWTDYFSAIRKNIADIRSIHEGLIPVAFPEGVQVDWQDVEIQAMISFRATVIHTSDIERAAKVCVEAVRKLTTPESESVDAPVPEKQGQVIIAIG